MNQVLVQPRSARDPTPRSVRVEPCGSRSAFRRVEPREIQLRGPSVLSLANPRPDSGTFGAGEIRPLIPFALGLANPVLRPPR